MKRLNLGAGLPHLHLPGWINCDQNPACDPELIMDVGLETWDPIGRDLKHVGGIGDCQIDQIRADNLLEHLCWPDLLHCLNECHRTLKAGGILWMRVPNAKLWPDGAFGDPTHIRFFVDKSFQYWDHRCPTYRDYGVAMGFRPWSLVKVSDYSVEDPRGQTEKAFFEREYTPIRGSAITHRCWPVRTVPHTSTIA